METVFVTIHDLSPDARIKYCSESVEYILGYLPSEVTERPCWDYFHPDEVPFAKLVHGRGVGLDRAAVFNYCRVKHKDGYWIGCECVFTIVYDVMIASTAIYQRGAKSSRRANDGAHIRRIFSSAPRDPRYHMLSYLSNKFYQEPQPHLREPRAALILNRFSRTSTIMFATNGVAHILGLQPHKLVGKSFYHCIAQKCLDSAIRCVESAKANDSIAYLRFWYRDPSQEEFVPRRASADSTGDDDNDDDNDNNHDDDDDDDEEGGVPIKSEDRSSICPEARSPSPVSEVMSDLNPPPNVSSQLPHNDHRSETVNGHLPSPSPYRLPVDDRCVSRSQSRSQTQSQSRSSSDDSAQVRRDDIFETPPIPQESSASSVAPQDDATLGLEIEAVISCTSDGLVVVIRHARPLASQEQHIAEGSQHTGGVFATPWAAKPMLPDGLKPADMMTAQRNVGADESVEPSFMKTIRDVAVFAWSLTSINGTLVEHAQGTATGEAQPAGGLPIWEPGAQVDERANRQWNGYANSTHRPFDDSDGSHMQDEEELLSPGKESSDDEVLWKRVPQQPPWKHPKRRAYHDAFGAHGLDSSAETADEEDNRHPTAGKNSRRRIGR